LDYLVGKRQSFNVVISLESLKSSFRETTRQIFLQSPPPELAGLSQAELGQYFDQFYQQFSSQIPSSLTFNQDSLGIDTRTITEPLNEAERVLADAKVYVGYFQLGYKLLIVFMLLLTIGIVLIHREVKGATRGLGIIFLTYGAFEYASIMILKYFGKSQTPNLYPPDFPAALQTWMTQLTNDLISPLIMFSLGMAIGGVILIITSFVYKPRQA